jgi:hypothetical protein
MKERTKDFPTNQPTFKKKKKKKNRKEKKKKVNDPSPKHGQLPYRMHHIHDVFREPNDDIIYFQIMSK